MIILFKVLMTLFCIIEYPYVVMLLLWFLQSNFPLR